MKGIWIKIACVASLIFTFAACSDNMGDTDSRLTDVKSLIEPSDGKVIALETAEAASVYFEWEHTNVNDGGTSVYQLAFDKVDGDFSSPVYMVLADNSGYQNHATLSHKLINKIAAKMGIFPSETGTFKWTVFSSKGEKAVKSGQANNITVTRLGGFDELPVDVFVTGEASEGGNDLSKAHKMKAVASGEFETYTYLKAGKPFYFTDATTGSPREFYTADGLVKENGSSTVATDGVYKVTLDFTIGACTYTLVTKIMFYFCPNNAHLFEIPYAGYGVFKAEKQTVTFKQEGWGRDERYKFRMFVKENGGTGEEKEWELCTLNGTDSRPNATSPESYYYIKLLTTTSQWEDKWKLMGDFDDVPANYTIYLTADQPYTHTITK